MKLWVTAVSLVVAGLAFLFASSTPILADHPRPLRSIAVYPAQRMALRMSHETPGHARLRCERCHEGASASGDVADRLIPVERSCSPCHDTQIRPENRRPGGTVGTPADPTRCALCHEGSPRRMSVPNAHLQFSHRTHSRQGVGCLDCHSVQDAGVATRNHLPTMESCFRCHGGEGVGQHRGDAPTGCTSCHEPLPDGRMRTHFDDAVLLPPRFLNGMDHDRDFLVRHRWIAADQGQTCLECHNERECVDCHDGRQRPDSVHPGDFLTTHGPMARRNENRCTSCHTVQRFCSECHARLGLSPMAAPRAAPAGVFHPSDWTLSHGAEARRSMTTCTSCHSERDCVTCHGAAGIGAGVSPHGPGFLTECRASAARNARACITCHGDVAALVSRCP